MSDFDDSCERGQGNRTLRRGHQVSNVGSVNYQQTAGNGLLTPTELQLIQNDSAHLESGIADSGFHGGQQAASGPSSAFSQYLEVLTPKMPTEVCGHLFDEQQDTDTGDVKPTADVVPHLQLTITNDETLGNHQQGRESKTRQCLRVLAHRNRANIHRHLLVMAIDRRLQNEYPFGSWLGKLQDKIFIVSICIFDFFTPSRRSGHLIWLASIVASISAVVFAFMAGAFPLYRFQKGYESDMDTLGWSPDELWEFVTVRDNTTEFDFDFLLGWGGRYLPSVGAGESYRWVTSLLLHQSFVHLMSNVLIFLALGSYLEYKYGSMRVAAVIVFSGLGGNFLSALAEDRCSIVVGGSGVVFGFMGFGLVDLVLNREVVLHTVARLAISFLFATFIVMTLVLEEYSSHVSHAGGFVCGFIPALLFAPNLKYERIEAVVVWVVAGFVVLIFMLLPICIYFGVLPNLEC